MKVSKIEQIGSLSVEQKTIILQVLSKCANSHLGIRKRGFLLSTDHTW